MFENLVRPEVGRMPLISPVPLFEKIMQEHGLSGILKMGNNENLLGVSPRAATAVAQGAKGCNFYPDPSCAPLRRALAERHGLSPDMIHVGAGGSGVWSNMVKAFIDPGDQVVMPGPTFPVYRLNTLIAGGAPVEVPLKDYYLDLEAMAEAINEKTKAVVVCNPNNPTGTVVDPRDLADFLDRLPDNVLAVVDDVYIDFVEDRYRFDPLGSVRAGRPLIAIRSFSKLYGLAGLRVGYALAPAELIGYLDRVRDGFPVADVSQAGALAALEDQEFREKTIAVVKGERLFLTQELSSLGFPCLPSQTNFLMADLGLPAQEVFDRLLSQGITVAPVRAWPDSTWIRITVGLRKDNQRLLTALKSILSGS